MWLLEKDYITDVAPIIFLLSSVEFDRKSWLMFTEHLPGPKGTAS